MIRLSKSQKQTQLPTKDILRVGKVIQFEAKAPAAKVALTPAWNDRNIPKADKGLFDPNLKRDELERQLRNKHLQSSRRQISQQRGDTVINQQASLVQAISSAKALVKGNEIAKLTRMIENQRNQNEKQAQDYERKKQEVERERLQLIELERRLLQEGARARKQVIKAVEVTEKPLREANQTQKLPAAPPKLSDVQLQAKIRQQRVKLLTQTRDRITAPKHPSLVPLISKASYRIISTHVSTLIELLVDDFLVQQVNLLEQIESFGELGRQKEREKRVLQDFHEQLDNFVEENQIISQRVGHYALLDFLPSVKGRRKGQLDQAQTEPVHQQPLKYFLEWTLNDMQMDDILSCRNRFLRLTSNLDEYKQSNRQMFDQCVEQLLDEALEKLTSQLDRGSADFVDMVFRSELS